MEQRKHKRTVAHRTPLADISEMSKPPQQRPPQPDDPLTPEEIKTAIETAGYPFEVEMYRVFSEAGMHPVLGFHTKVGIADEIREIDLLASLHEHIVAPGEFSSVSMTAIIGAKKPKGPCKFVGIIGDEPSQHGRRSARAYAPTGLPSHGIIQHIPDSGMMQTLLGPGGFGEAMDPMVAAPFCVHWAVAGRKGNGEPHATGEKPYWEDLHNGVRAALRMSRDIAKFRLGRGSTLSPFPELRFYHPTLILDTDHLYLYDPSTRSLSTTDWLILSRMYDVGGGEAIHRLVDVVARDGVPRLINAYKETAKLLRGVMEKRGNDLAEVGRKQAAAWQENASR